MNKRKIKPLISRFSCELVINGIYQGNTHRFSYDIMPHGHCFIINDVIKGKNDQVVLVQCGHLF